MYNPSNNSWSQKANFPGGKRMSACAFELYGIGYMGTGLYDANTVKSDFWKYTPNTNTWTAIQDFPGNGRFGMVGFTLNNEAYVGTGDDNIDKYIDFFKYNPLSNSWTGIISPQAPERLSGISFSIGNKGYFGTGWDEEFYFSDFWVYSPNRLTDIDNKYIAKNQSISVFPNPANNNIFIEINNNLELESELFIHDINGQLILNKNINDKSTNLDFST